MKKARILIWISVDIKYPPLKSKLPRQPKCKIPAVEAFLTAVENGIFNDTKPRNVRDNLSKEDMTALKSWQNDILFNKNSTLCLRLQDKGNRFVIVDKEEDIRKATEQIERSSFIELDSDPTEKHISTVKAWALKWRNREKISKQWFNFIVNESARPAKNSTLYKTHKIGNPVRLLTAGCNTPIENLCRFIEQHTYPLVENIPTRIRDTSHFLEIIDDINKTPLPDNALIVSFDIVNMYPSISNEQGIKAVKNALNKRVHKSPPTACILEALEITLSCNNSIFNDKMLLQNNGTATGAPNSCSYADLATVHIDEKVEIAQRRKFTELKLFKKYRDDVFSVWIGEPKRLDEFLIFLNGIDKNLKFTMDVGVLFFPSHSFSLDGLVSFYSKLLLVGSDVVNVNDIEITSTGLFYMWSSSIANIDVFLQHLNCVDSSFTFDYSVGKHKLRFLDVEIIHVGDHLEHTVYKKPTNSQMYLDFKSCHPISCKNGIAKGVALRLRRNCSTDTEYIKKSRQFMAYLAARGHDPHIIYMEFLKILNTPRQQTRKKREKSSNFAFKFITKYNPLAPNIKRIINENLNILYSDKIVKNILPSISVINKRCKNLSEIVMRADPYNIPERDTNEGGSLHCGKACDLCNSLTHSRTFKCHATGRSFVIRPKLCCTSINVVYLMSCANCLHQGIGSTQNMKPRWANYKSHSNKKINSCSISRHFNEICRCVNNPREYMQIQLIDSVDNTNNMNRDEIDELLLKKEKFWVGSLVTMHKGMNSSHDWNRKQRIGGENFEDVE